MNIKRLRLLTIILPVAFFVALEIVSIVFLRPVLGNNSGLRLLVIFGVLSVAVVPFAVWVFGTIERQQRDLAESAELLESVRDYAIFMLDTEGRIVTWSPGAERVKGYTEEEILGQHYSRFFLPEDVEHGEPDDILLRAANEGRIEVEGWRVRRNGSRFWANVVSTVVRDERDNLIGFTHVTRDMTERRHAEERIRTLNEELGQRVTELNAAHIEVARRNHQLDAINTAIRSISGPLDLDQVLQNITEAAQSLVNSRYAALGVADESGRILRFITTGITLEQRAAIGPLPVGHGLLGVLIKDAKPLRISGISDDPNSSGFPLNHPPMKSLLGVPILFKGRPVGDLYLTNKIGADEFSSEDQELLMLLANHAAVAIENSRLYEDARDARDRLQTWNVQLEAIVAERTREIERGTKQMKARVLQAQEEERKRIARELHDETAQSLSTILITLDLYESFLPEDNDPLRNGFDRIRELARRTLDETRALSHDLRPPILDDIGLIAALRWYADEHLRTFGVPVEVNAEAGDELPLTPEQEIAIFRIAQEALNNSGKYAQAGKACISLSVGGLAAKLVIEDDGRGFDPEQLSGPNKSGGFGLFGMRERAALLDGHLSIESAPGRGTFITATIPLSDEAETVPVASTSQSQAQPKSYSQWLDSRS